MTCKANDLHTLDGAIAEARRVGSSLNTALDEMRGQNPKPSPVIGSIRVRVSNALPSPDDRDYFMWQLIDAVLEVRDGVYRWRDPVPTAATKHVHADECEYVSMQRPCNCRGGQDRCSGCGRTYVLKVKAGLFCARCEANVTPPEVPDDGGPAEACKARWNAYECAIVGPHDRHAAEGRLTTWDDAARTDRNVDVPHAVPEVADAALRDAFVAGAACAESGDIARFKDWSDAASDYMRRGGWRDLPAEVADDGGPLELRGLAFESDIDINVDIAQLGPRVDAVYVLMLERDERLMLSPKDADALARMLTIAAQRARKAVR